MPAPERDDAALRSSQDQGSRARSAAPRPEDHLGLSSRLSVGEFALFALRLALGLSMLQVAYKLMRGGWDAWVNASALLPSVVQGPLGNIYAAVWGDPFVLWMAIIGSGAVGLGLCTGFLTRLSAAVGTFMMLGFYTADLPPSSGWFDVQLVQMFAFFLVASMGAGHVWGIDALIRRMESKPRWWDYFLG